MRSPATMDDRLETVRRTLRAKLRDAAGAVAVEAADLRFVLDELGRLQQGNDRLRRQNRRMRLRLQRAGLAEGGDGDAGDGGDAAQDAP